MDDDWGLTSLANYITKVQTLETSYRFKTTGWDKNLRCITFTRTVERGDIHEVVIEDHRDDEKINDWLIFSYLKDCITNVGGMPDDAQYPLELGEYKLFAKLIECFEKLYPIASEEEKNDG